MNLKLPISLILACAFWLHASSNQNGDDEPATDEFAPRSASVAFVNAQPEELLSCSTNAATASDCNAELDAADFAEIAGIRAIVFEPPLNAKEQEFLGFMCGRASKTCRNNDSTQK